MHPAQIKETINLAYQMIRRHHLVEIKRIKELSFSALPPTHHARLPLKSVSNRRNHGSRAVSTRVLQHNPPESRHCRRTNQCLIRAESGRWPSSLDTSSARVSSASTVAECLSGLCLRMTEIQRNFLPSPLWEDV